MDEKEGASSIQAHSDDIKLTECNPCKYEGICKDAITFCLVCNENLCHACEQFHKKFSSTRKHETVSLRPVTKTERPRKQATLVTPLCSCNMKEIEMFCSDHYGIICSDCNFLKHRDCSTLAIEKACEAVDETFSELTDKKVAELRTRALEAQRSETAAVQKLDKTTEELQNEVKEYRREINAKVDEMERKALQEIDKYESERRKIAQWRLDTVNNVLRKLDSENQLLLDVRSAGEQKHLFIKNVQILKIMYHSNKILNEISRNSHDRTLVFTRETVLKETAESLGKFSKENSDNFIDKAIVSKGTIDTEMQSDGACPLISGSVFMPKGELVVCDHNNKKIKLLSKTFTRMNSIEVNGKPWDVARTKEDEVVVTLPNIMALQFVQVFPKLKKRHAVAFGKECRGVATSDGCIYVTFVEGYISILSEAGELIKNICQQTQVHPLLCPYYLSVGKKGNIYISCYCEVNCVTPDGDVVFCYKDKGLSYGFGLILDDDENVLVCGCYDNNIHLIGRDGKKIKLYLMGINKPHTICFREKDNVLIVGGETKDKLLFFQLENMSQ